MNTIPDSVSYRPKTNNPKECQYDTGCFIPYQPSLGLSEGAIILMW